MKKESHQIVSTKEEVYWFTFYQTGILYLSARTNNIVWQTLDGKKKEILIKYDGILPQNISRIEDYLIFCTDTQIEIIDLKRKEMVSIGSARGLAHSCVVANSSKVFFSFQPYTILGNYDEKLLESKWKGSWEISLEDIKKRNWKLKKISENYYEKIYCVKNVLYDDKGKKILSSE